jgi:hypothetical protein
VSLKVEAKMKMLGRLLKRKHVIREVIYKEATQAEAAKEKKEEEALAERNRMLEKLEAVFGSFKENEIEQE